MEAPVRLNRHLAKKDMVVCYVGNKDGLIGTWGQIDEFGDRRWVF